MPRLPIPGSDEGVWGDILNDFLKVEHDSSTGQLKIRTDGTLAAKYEKPVGGIPESDLDSSVQTKLNSGGGGSGDVSSNTSSTSTGQLVIFANTGGKTVGAATQSGIVKLTSGVIGTASSGIDYYAPSSTDVAVADGGTGASTASQARTNLGLEVGTDVMGYDPDLDAIAGIITNGLIAKTGSGNAASRSIAAGSAKISITNGNGVAGNPTVDLGSVSIDDLSDVAITTPADGNILIYSSGSWINSSPSYQAQDSDLTAIAGLSTTGLIVRTGAGTATTVAAPTGTVVGTSDTQTLTNKRINKRVVALTDGATIATNSDNGDVFTVTLGGNRTMANPTGAPVDGQRLMYRITQDATGTRTLVWDTAFRFSTDIPSPQLTATAAKTDYVGFVYNSASSTWDCIAVARGY